MSAKRAVSSAASLQSRFDELVWKLCKQKLTRPQIQAHPEVRALFSQFADADALFEAALTARIDRAAQKFKLRDGRRGLISVVVPGLPFPTSGQVPSKGQLIQRQMQQEETRYAELAEVKRKKEMEMEAILRSLRVIRGHVRNMTLEDAEKKAIVGGMDECERLVRRRLG